MGLERGSLEIFCYQLRAFLLERGLLEILERFEETHVLVVQVFNLPPTNSYLLLVVFISDASGAVFEAEKVRLSEKLWFHRSCFTCKACHGFLDVLRWGDDGGYDYDGGYDDGNLIGNNDG